MNSTLEYICKLVFAPVRIVKCSMKKLFPSYYRWKYNVSFFKFIFLKQFKGLFKIGKNQQVKYDLVFCVIDGGWILEKLCLEISKQYPKKYHFHYGLDSLPEAKNYYFSHYSDAAKVLETNPIVWGSKIFAWYTHECDYYGIIGEEIVYTFNKMTKIICMNADSVKRLTSEGVLPEKLTYILGASNPEMFKPHKRLNGAVGFCTRYYERKKPELILDIIKSMPYRKFILIGKKWEEFSKFSEMQDLDNFKYVDVEYSEYPKYYDQMDVFVSPSDLEGGPIPLVEAMMCNIVPVASRTGFAPDIIQHGENGFIFDIGSGSKTICDLIDKAYDLKTNVNDAVKDLTWENFSRNIVEVIEKV